MLIGIDFDNTIVSYDDAFHAIAVERGLIAAGTPMVKNAVRDAMRRTGREDEWTLLQGHVYGPGMERARPFPGVVNFLRLCRERRVPVRVISHRTMKPFMGPEHDLHDWARRWLLRNHFFEDTGLSPEHVFFEETKTAKLARIAEQGCTLFIDDLPEFLVEPGFPESVGRILFDPSGTHESPFAQARSWAEIETLTLGVADLLGLAGLARDCRLFPAPGAANNRTFHLKGAGFRALLKAYFSHPGDPRDRSGAEAAFSRFAWDCGLRQLPQPLACDPGGHLSLFELIEGRSLSPEEVDENALGQALGFFTEINRHRRSPRASSLPGASEACFSLAEHLALVDNRMGALLSLPPSDSALEVEVSDFVRDELAPAWTRTRASVSSHARRIGIDPGRVLPESERCISPSDFGFHNALLEEDGRLRFLDFEYAGWDDPAKTICDFFEQPALPAPEASRSRFAEGVSAALGGPPGLIERAELLHSVYRIKWACILLNDFLPTAAERRRFALGGAGLSERRRLQLRKARVKLRQEAQAR